jgi:tRNA (guanosine-2'-O-)-methyltransferase
MRRQTPGVLTTDELVNPRIRRAESHDPMRVVRILEPLVGEARRARLKEVIARRLASVAVVLDSPYDPHNGAAVVRSAEAFGVQRLHVLEKRGYPFLVAESVARGAQKWLDVVRHTDASGLVNRVREEGFELVAADPDGDLVPSDLARLPRAAIVLGNEKEGIQGELAHACARSVRVPMRGFVESLNVSVTAAILLHAATRGREGDLDERDRQRLYARGLYLSVPRAEELIAASSG